MKLYLANTVPCVNNAMNTNGESYCEVALIVFALEQKLRFREVKKIPQGCILGHTQISDFKTHAFNQHIYELFGLAILSVCRTLELDKQKFNSCFYHS